ncbi:MAG: tyrosine-type recombinase/integrase [Phycisphaerae bacterium]
MASAFKRTTDRRKKGSKWVASFYDHEAGKWRSRTGFTDREATLELARRLEKESARRKEGLDDPVDGERLRGIQEHVDDYIHSIEIRGRAPRYVQQVRQRIERVLRKARVTRLVELDPVKVQAVVHELKKTKGEGSLGDVAKNEYITAMKSFSTWCVKNRRMGVDPLASLEKIEAKRITRVHPRRALTSEELGRLLDAARRRPLLDAKTVRTGPNKGKPIAKVTDRVRAKRELKGMERRLAYLLAAWTGLRRSEIRKLEWRDVHLDAEVPAIHLRAETTKSRRADALVLHPQVVEALQEWSNANGQDKGRVVSTVPDMKTMKADLELAGIPYGDAEIGFVDLHAQRMALGTHMAVNGVSQRVRQAHMRHKDPRLTEMTYMDEKLLPVAQEICRVPAIPEPGSKGTGTHDIHVDEKPGVARSAENMHKGIGTNRHSGSRADTGSQKNWSRRLRDRLRASLSQTPSKSVDGTKKQDPASDDAESCRKRAMRFELTTFTLAT